MKKGMTKAMCLMLAGVVGLMPLPAHAAQLKEEVPAASAEAAETKHKLKVKYYFESLEETELEKDGVYYEELETYPAVQTEVEDNYLYIPTVSDVEGFTLNEQNLSLQRITEDTEIIQYYSRNSYTLKVAPAEDEEGIKNITVTILDSGAGSVVDNTATVKYGASVSLKAYMNTHFTFKEWVDGNKKSVGTAAAYTITMPAEDTTIYATSKLAEGYAYYTMEWYKETGTEEIGKTTYESYKTEKAVGKVGEKVSIAEDESISSADYELNEKVQATVKTAEVKESGTVLKLFYDKKHITLNYELDGAENNKNNVSWFKKAAKQYVYPVQKEGYTFDGWYYDKEYKNRLKTSGTTQYFESASASPVTIYAKFSKMETENTENEKTKTPLEELAAGKEISAIGATYKQSGEVAGNTVNTSLIQLNIMYKDGSMAAAAYDSLSTEPLTQVIKEGKNTITFKIDTYEVSLEVTGYIGKNNVEVADGRELTIGTDIYKISSTKKKEVTYEYTSGKKTTVTIPSYILVNGVQYKVTKVADSCFKNNKKVKKVTVPDTVTAIGKNAFCKCTALTTVTLGTGVKKIGKQAFYGCKKLKTVNVKSKKLTEVGKNAFGGISKKAKFNLPKKKAVYNKYKKLLQKGQAKTCKYVKKYK